MDLAIFGFGLVMFVGIGALTLGFIALGRESEDATGRRAQWTGREGRSGDWQRAGHQRQRTPKTDVADSSAQAAS